MRYLLFILIFTCAFNSKAQVNIITTIAGNGIRGYGGDGGPATNAKVNVLQTLCYYKNAVYAPDAFNSRIRKVDLLTGIITTVGGIDTFGYNGDNIPATDAELWVPSGICVDTIGNIYFGDGGNMRIRKIDAQTGLISTIAGNGIAGYSGDGGQATNAELNGAFGMTMDKYGNIYFSDFNNSVVRKINTSGIITTIAGNGFIGYSGDGGPATDAELNLPNKAMIDTSGNIIIMDGFNYIIRKVNATTGIISTIAGTPGVLGYAGDGGPATSALFNGPSQGYVDKWNNIYFADDENGVIRKIDGAGIITTIVGIGDTGFSGDGGPATAAKLYPTDVCADSFGTMYIADLFNYRIRMVYNPRLGVNTQSVVNNDVHVFPNPTQNAITVKYDFVNDGEMQITDITGRIVIERALNRAKQEEEIDVRSLSPGLYLYKVVQNNMLTSAGKIIKE